MTAKWQRSLGSHGTVIWHRVVDGRITATIRGSLDPARGWRWSVDGHWYAHHTIAAAKATVQETEKSA